MVTTSCTLPAVTLREMSVGATRNCWASWSENSDSLYCSKVMSRVIRFCTTQLKIEAHIRPRQVDCPPLGWNSPASHGSHSGIRSRGA